MVGSNLIFLAPTTMSSEQEQVSKKQRHSCTNNQPIIRWEDGTEKQAAEAIKGLRNDVRNLSKIVKELGGKSNSMTQIATTTQMIQRLDYLESQLENDVLKRLVENLLNSMIETDEFDQLVLKVIKSRRD